jgi:hypothetical protein
MAERQDHRSSEEIRRDIEGTRTELRETVVALERKLSLGQVVDEVWGRVGGRRTGGDAVSKLGDTIRDHPLPLALMGLGVAWLAVDKAKGDGDDVVSRGIGPGTYDRADGRVGPYRGDTVHESTEPSSMDKAKHDASGMAEKAKDKASEVASKARGLASDAKRKMSDARDSFGSSHDGESGNGESHAWHGGDESEISDRAGEAVDRAREGARRGAEKARHGLRAAMDEQPLALGAVAFGLGLASGLAVPTTRWEDEAMGAAADAVKEEAGSLAKDATRDVKQVAASAASAAKDEAGRQTGQLKDAASSVASEAKQAAKEEMRDRDLDAAGMKARAKKSRERTEERLTD